MEINTVYDSIKKPHHLEYKPFIKMRLPFNCITIVSMIFFLLSISDIASKQFIYIKVWRLFRHFLIIRLVSIMEVLV